MIGISAAGLPTIGLSAKASHVGILMAAFKGNNVGSHPMHICGLLASDHCWQHLRCCCRLLQAAAAVAVKQEEYSSDLNSLSVLLICSVAAVCTVLLLYCTTARHYQAECWPGCPALHAVRCCYLLCLPGQ